METTNTGNPTGGGFDELNRLTFADLCERFADEESAIRFLEAVRWPNGPYCPRCGCCDVGRVAARRRRRPVLYCNGCKQQFSVTVGTVMEDTKIALHKWLWAIHLMCASKKGISALQLSRMLGLAYRSAWHLAHRIRHAMQTPDAQKLAGIVEADATFVGGRARGRHKYREKKAVITIIERNGRAVSIVAHGENRETVTPALALVDSSATLMTDDAHAYWTPGKRFVGGHHAVRHTKGEYVRGRVHTNTVEGFFANFKRGLHGTFHHVSVRHLARYLDEFDYRYNLRGVTDGERALDAMRRADGKRLCLFRAVSAPHAPSLQDDPEWLRIAG